MLMSMGTAGRRTRRSAWLPDGANSGSVPLLTRGATQGRTVAPRVSKGNKDGYAKARRNFAASKRISP